MPPIIKEIEESLLAKIENVPAIIIDSGQTKPYILKAIRSALRRVVEAQTNYLKDWAGALDPTTVSPDYFEGVGEAIETLVAKADEIIHSLENKQ